MIQGSLSPWCLSGKVFLINIVISIIITIVINIVITIIDYLAGRWYFPGRVCHLSASTLMLNPVPDQDFSWQRWWWWWSWSIIKMIWRWWQWWWLGEGGRQSRLPSTKGFGPTKSRLKVGYFFFLTIFTFLFSLFSLSYSSHAIHTKKRRFICPIIVVGSVSSNIFGARFWNDLGSNIVILIRTVCCPATERQFCFHIEQMGP